MQLLPFSFCCTQVARESTGGKMERRIGCVLLLLLCCLSRVALTEDVDVEVEEPPTDTESKAKEEIATTPVYRSPEPTGHAYMAENFDDRESFEQTWIFSEAKKDDIDDDISKYDGKYNSFSMSNDF